MALSKKEKGEFVKLFYRGGYVLNFNTREFDEFTTDSVGLALVDHYRLSKGRSLINYVKEAPDDQADKLLLDLFHYYENEYIWFYQETGYGEKDEIEPGILGFDSKPSLEYRKQYEKCKAIAEGAGASSKYLENSAQNIKEAFSSEYIDKQVHSMIALQKENPTDAIGKAKELIESCCKAILEENSTVYDKDWDLTRFVKETMDKLKIMPAHIPDTVPAASSIKAILNHLKTIAQNVAELRNPYGSGHGKSPSYKGLEERHAKLAVGSALTLVNFLWDSHLRVKSQQTK